MLNIKGLTASYGTSQVLFGVDLNIKSGEAVALLGKNGMGKSTTIKSILGVLQPQEGSLSFEDCDIKNLPSFKIARLGIGWVSEGRHVFPNLTVVENLIAVAANRHNAPHVWTLGSVLELFPGLKSRSGSIARQLSGGEQQMLAIGRALMTNPKLLILDEATEGLAPLIREDIWRVIKHLKSMGQSILIVDKHVEVLTRLVDSHYILEKGKVVWQGSSIELKRNKDIQLRYLGV